MTDEHLESILHQALRPEIDPADIVVHRKKGKTMNTVKLMKRAVIIAAVILLLATTAYATGLVQIKSLVSGRNYGNFQEYSQIGKAMKLAEFRIDSVETFANGYTFALARVEDTEAWDENDNVQFHYSELNIHYRNPAGNTLYLCTRKVRDDLPESRNADVESRTYGDITAYLSVTHYKMVPPDYQLTAEDEANLKLPNYEISYGSDSVEETDMAFVNWEKNGINYGLMDMRYHENADTLFSMAEELILK